MANPNYTLGRGKVLFARFLAGTQTPGPLRYIGNTPEFNLTVESETLDHHSSDEGIRQKDASVLLEVTRTGSLICDDIQADNVALFFFGTTSVLTTASAAGQSENFDAVIGGMFYQIGMTPTNPVGIRGIGSVTVVSNPAGTTYALDDDYKVDTARGMIEIVEGGAAAGQNITVNYNVVASTQDLILSGSEPVEGALKYIENNPRGADRDLYLPYAKITPNGDLAFKGDEWRQIPFSIEALKPVGQEAIYINGQPR